METTIPSKAARVAGWTLTILPVLLFLFSGGMKLAHPPQLDEGFRQVGLPVSWASWLGVLELLCTAIYLVPRSAVLGAILLTGYLGGAIVTQLRANQPPVMPIVLGILVWGGLWLRDPRLRQLIPFAK